jgi:arylsulfatase A-like enzyme
VTSDHGDHIGEHGLADHQASLDDHLINVPFVAWGPGIVPHGRRTTSVHEFVDVLPSVASLLDLQQPEGIPEGRRTGLLGAPERQERGVAFAEWRAWAADDLARVSKRHPRYDFGPLVRDLVCARDDRYKFVQRGDGSRALYDLFEDPHEDRDIADERPDDVTRLSAALERERSTWPTVAQTAGAGEPGLSGQQEDEIERHLADLGYL